MAYTKNVWVDEVLASDPKYQVKNDSGVVVYSDAEIALSTGVVTPGTALNAAKMNNIETGIETLDLALTSLRASATELTISSDAITITQSNHKLQPQTGTADNLSTINGISTIRSGVLYCSDYGTDTITIKHNVGNILCAGGSDITLSYGCVFWFSDGTKVFVSGGGGGGAAASTDGWTASAATWTYSSGIRTQAYTNDPAAGADIALNMTDTSGMQIGHDITVSSSAGSEVTYIKAITTNTNITAANLTLNHTTTNPLVTIKPRNYVVSVNADMTGILSLGMRVKYTQDETVKFGLVSAIGAFSGGNTLVTLQHNTNQAMTASAITLPYYSNMKVPFNFPMDESIWNFTRVDSTLRTQVNPAASTWYNIGGVCVAFPIGAWKDITYFGVLQFSPTTPGTTYESKVTLSTSNNAESDTQFTASIISNIANGLPVARSKPLVLTSPTTYYYNSINVQGFVGSLHNRNDSAPLIITAKNSYL